MKTETSRAPDINGRLRRRSRRLSRAPGKLPDTHDVAHHHLQASLRPILGSTRPHQPPQQRNPDDNQDGEQDLADLDSGAKDPDPDWRKATSESSSTTIRFDVCGGSSLKEPKATNRRAVTTRITRTTRSVDCSSERPCPLRARRPRPRPVTESRGVGPEPRRDAHQPTACCFRSNDNCLDTHHRKLKT